MRKKRPMLLLELMVALFLVSYLLLPLVNGFPLLFSKQIGKLRAVECERIASATYLEVKTTLKNRHSFSELTQKHITEKLPSLTLFLGDLKPIDVERSYQVYLGKTKKGRDNKTYNLLHCDVTLKCHKFKKTYPNLILIYQEKS
ncbi:MAG: hypothetical protein P0S94_05225 [Simkaniaceae bacterium]|nr:hypothetical protein [Simkaniaceae bacterium]